MIHATAMDVLEDPSMKVLISVLGHKQVEELQKNPESCMVTTGVATTKIGSEHERINPCQSYNI